MYRDKCTRATVKLCILFVLLTGCPSKSNNDTGSAIAETHFKQGVACLKHKKYDQAIVEFNKAIAINPNYAEYYYSRGYAYAGKKQHEEAITDFTRAIELKPDYVDAYVRRGFSYAYLLELPEATSDVTKALEINPNHQMAQELLELLKNPLQDKKVYCNEDKALCIVIPKDWGIIENKG